MRALKAITVTGLAAALMGCVTPYVEPQGATAVLRMELPREFRGNDQKYYISTEYGLAGEQVTPYLHRFGFQATSSEDRRIAAGQPVYVTVVSNHTTGATAYTIFYENCSSRMSFVPEVGRTYIARHHSQIRTCRLEIVDAATGLPPSTLQMVALGASTDARSASVPDAVAVGAVEGKTPNE